MIVRTIGVLLWLVLSGCAGAAPEDGPPADIPEDAIAVGEDMYMVPLGRDAGGCMMFQAHAPDKLVAQVIQYRTADGRFVANKREAACMTEKD